MARQKKSAKPARTAAEYRYQEKTPARPDVGTQPQFKKRAPPKTWRYDSSLSPSLDWDGQNAAREQGDALIREILEAKSLDKAKEAADKLKAISKPYESHRDPGSTNDVDFWTSRDVREVIRSHVNFVVADTKTWEQSATYLIDTHPAVTAFVKNAGLGFAIPYIDNGQMHDYVPDFILPLNGSLGRHLILEIKGFDEREEIKKSAAERWINAVNADGTFGVWTYAIAKKVSDVPALISFAAH